MEGKCLADWMAYRNVVRPYNGPCEFEWNYETCIVALRRFGPDRYRVFVAVGLRGFANRFSTRADAVAFMVRMVEAIAAGERDAWVLRGL